MKARLVRWSVPAGNHDRMAALASDLVPAIREQPGCQDVVFFGDDAAGEWGLLVRWDSQDAAMAAASVIRPRLDAHLMGLARSAADARLFDILDV